MKPSLCLLYFLVPVLAQASDILLPEIGVDLPEQIGAFSYTGKTDYGNGLGYSVEYAQRAGKITIYVYNKNEKNIQDGKNTPLVLRELAGAELEIETAEKLGYYRNLQKESLSKDLKQATLPYAVSAWGFDISSGRVHSYILVRGYHQYFLKIRASLFIINGTADTQALVNFIQALNGFLGLKSQDNSTSPPSHQERPQI